MTTLFNDKFVQGLKSKDKKYLVTEDKAERKGGRFCIEVLPNGTKNFYIVYYFEGKRKLQKFGQYGTIKDGKLTLAQARKKYIELGLIVNEGLDPKTELAKQVAEQERQEIAKQAEIKREQAQGSFGQMLDLYLAFLKEHRSFKHYNNVRKAFQSGDLDHLREIKANQITKGDILHVLKQVVERGSLSAADKLRVYLSGAFSNAIKQENSVNSLENSDLDFNLETNPVSVIQKIEGADNVGERWLNENELQFFWHDLENSGMTISIRLLIQFLICTGQRIEQCCLLEWSQIDNDLWLCPPSIMKTKQAHIVPLGNVALNILEQAEHIRIGSYVFSGQNPKEPLYAGSPNRAIQRISKSLDMPSFTARDLRTTYKTLSGKAGLSKEIRDRIQHHAHTDVSAKHYDRYDYLPEKKLAMQQWDTYLTRIVSGKFDDTKVIQFKK